MIILGVDVGSGVKSATGLAALETETFSILTVGIWPENRKDKANKRLQSLASKFPGEIGDDIDVAVFESFAMRGKSGETLQRLIGAYMSALPKKTEIIEVANTKVKQYIGGSGKSDKEEVGQGVLDWFKDKNKSAYKTIEGLIKKEKWDEVDAVAIAISGYLSL